MITNIYVSNMDIYHVFIEYSISGSHIQHLILDLIDVYIVLRHKTQRNNVNNFVRTFVHYQKISHFYLKFGYIRHPLSASPFTCEGMIY